MPVGVRMTIHATRYRATWRGKLVLQVLVDVFVFGTGWIQHWRDATLTDFASPTNIPRSSTEKT